jgi:hypothetical protein
MPPRYLPSALALARSGRHLCEIVDRLQAKGVALRILNMNLDTNDATGKLISDRDFAGPARPSIQNPENLARWPLTRSGVELHSLKRIPTPAVGIAIKSGL